MEAAEEVFDLDRMIEMAKTVSESTGALEIDLLCQYLRQYVLMLKTLGKLVEIGFSDVAQKSTILQENKKKFEEKGAEIGTIEKLVEYEIELGLKNVNGNNNSKKGIKKGDEFYTHTGSCRTTERVLRFLAFVERIMENMHKDRKASLTTCVKGAYEDCLAAHHGFLLRNTIKGILYLLPNRDTFLNGVTESAGPMDDEKKYSLMNELIENSQKLTTYIREFLKERE